MYDFLTSPDREIPETDRDAQKGVNVAKDYVRLMKFGTIDEQGEVVVTDSLLQGGIVCPNFVKAST